MISVVLNGALILISFYIIRKVHGLNFISFKAVVDLVAEAFLLMLIVIGFLEYASLSSNPAIQDLVAKYQNALTNQVQSNYYPIKSVLGAVLDELIIRGPYLVLAFIFTELICKKQLKIKSYQRKLLNAAFIFGSAYLFAVAHSLELQQVYAFFIGLILAHKTVKRRNIVEPIILHVAFNVLNLTILTNYISLAWQKG